MIEARFFNACRKSGKPCDRRQPDALTQIRLGWKRGFAQVPLTVALVIFAGSSRSAAHAQETEYPELSEHYSNVIRLRQDILSQRARISVLQAEKALLDERLKATKSPTTSALPELLPIVRATWIGSGNQRKQAIEKYVATRERLVSTAESDWRIAQESALQFREHHRQVMLKIGGNFAGEQTRSWTRIIFWVLPGAVLLICVSLLLRFHERRTLVRRNLRGKAFAKPTVDLQAMLLIGLGAVTVSGCGSGQPTASKSDWIAAEIASLTELETKLSAELSLLRKESTAAQENVDLLREQYRDRYRKLLDDGQSGEQSGPAHAILSNEDGSLRELEKAFEADAMLPLYKQATDDLAKEIAEQQDSLKQFVDNNKARTIWYSTMSVAASGVVALAAVIPFVFARLATTHRRLKERATCPRCLDKGTLKVEKSRMYCEGCKSFLPLSLRELDRLCFPTVGVRASGKTHWMLEFFDQVRNDDVRVKSTIQSVESGSEVEGLFDNMIKQLRGGDRKDGDEPYQIEGTVYEKDRIPEPLLFSIRDRDSIRPRSDMNLLMFDVSGEMMTTDIDTDKLKSRAMQMDGFVLFLDPRQVAPTDKKLLTKEDQLRAIQKQRSEMKRVRKLGENDVLDVPVAVCIPKLDLLPRYSPLGDAAHEYLDMLRKDEHEPPSLELIQKRSDITAQYIREIFSGWNIKKTMETNFGERYMFFPLTPVNIVKQEIQNIGNDDLANRSHRPFGIQEPILWLLHMSGYCVFD